MEMRGNGNSPHGNPMGMGISQKLGNGGGREWKLNRWEWEGMGMLKAIPAHLYLRSDRMRYHVGPNTDCSLAS